MEELCTNKTINQNKVAQKLKQAEHVRKIKKRFLENQQV